MPAFMTDEWFTAAEAASGDASFDTGVAAVLNLNISGTEAGDVEAHIDTSAGLAMGKGHAENPNVTLTIPAALAKKMFIDGDASAGMTAYMSGQLKVDGDITKVLALQGALGKPEAIALREKLAAVTD